MPLFPSSGLAEAIVTELCQGPMEMPLLLERLTKRGLITTKQGVYKALSHLRTQEIAFLQKGELSLNVRWLQRLEQFLSVAQHEYFDARTTAGQFANLRDGERITYVFKSFVSVDTFWNHVLYVLSETIPGLDRWYAYCPHHWFLLAHRKEELALMRHMAKRNISYLFTSGSNTPLDRAVKKDFTGTDAQYHVLEKPLHASPRYLFNVLGDFVIEAWYDPHITNKIEQFYREHTSVTQADLAELEAIVTAPGRTKFSIRRHKKKAVSLIRPLKKYFAVKKDALSI